MKLGQAVNEIWKPTVMAAANKVDDTRRLNHHRSMDDMSANAIRRNNIGACSADLPSRRSTMGSLTAEVVGRCESKSKACTEFTIAVRNGWSVISLNRRYSEFAALDKEVRPTMSTLPELPPRSFFKKLSSSLMNDPSFMNEREHGLGKVLEAMIDLDPLLRNTALREFLGVKHGSCTFDGR
jgi:hypothetical protein